MCPEGGGVILLTSSCFLRDSTHGKRIPSKDVAQGSMPLGEDQWHHQSKTEEDEMQL